MTAFIDTSILIYLTNEDERYHADAVGIYETSKKEGPIIISDIVYSEFSSAVDSIENTDKVLSAFAFERLGFSKEALFLAGKAYRKYKNDNSGPKLNVLPDFLIGAQALTANAKLLTNNKKDFLAYFPELNIVSIA